MKVFPRIIEVVEGEENFVFINNASSTDRLLFFKVKRSDPKVIEFHPRKGVIEAGITSKVRIKIVGDNISTARILVQLVAVTRDVCKGTFETDWAAGSVSGVVNKVVDIHRKPSQSATLGGLSFEPPEVLVNTDTNILEVVTVNLIPPLAYLQSSDQHNGLDATESADPLQRLQVGGPLQSNFAEQNLHDALGIDLTMTTDPNTSRAENHSVSQKTTVNPRSGHDDLFDMSISALEDNIIDAGTAKPYCFRMEGLTRNDITNSHRQGPGIAYETCRETVLAVEHDTVDTRLLSEIMSRQSMLTGSEPMTSPLINVDLDRALLAHIQRIDGDRREAEVGQNAHSPSNARHSSIRGLLPSDYSDMLGAGECYETKDSDCLVLIGGLQATESLVAGSIETRTGEAMQSRRRVTAISIRNSPVASMANSVCAAFQRKRVVGSPHEMAASAMSFLLDSQLRHLSITHTGLQVIDPCLNRFEKLMTLDLSRNQIVRIGGQIELPCLLSLDLSNNMLSSLDFLQNLRSLSSLCLHSNCITSLAESVNMMVPLGRTLNRFDMRKNAVCRDERYAEQAMGILPHLALFDGRDIQKLKEEALRKRPPCRDASSSKLSRTDSFCNSVGSRSEISLSLEQGESSSQWGDFDRRLRRLLKTRAFSRQQTAPSSKSREEVSNSQQTRKYRPNLGAAMRKQSESSDEFKRSEERETLTDTTMSHSPNRSPGSPPPLPLPTAQAPVTMVPNSLRNSIASFLSETIENGEDDDRSWIEDAHDYLNLLTSTPPGAGKEALSPSHSATRSPSALRDGIAELKIQPKQSAKKETFASPTSSSAANKIAPEKSTKAVVDRSPEEKALLRERRKRQQALTVSLMEPTEGQALRRKALGLSATSSGYESEESTSRRARRRVGSPFDGNLTADNFTAIQADDGHNKWNPRYRVPTHPYGYSKPFSRHPEPSSPYSIPSYVETVERMRRSTDVKPNRGTFGRTKRCSNAELGPPHSHYADSRAIIAANRGIGMPFSGLGEEKDIRDGARWIKQGVRSSSVAPDIRGRRKLTHSPRTVSTSNSPLEDRGARSSRSHSVDSFSGSRRWVSYGSQDTLQNLWDSTVGNCTSDQSTFKYPDASHQGEPGYLSSIRDRESQGPDGEEGDGFLESKSDINFNAPIYVEEECAVGGQAKSLFALASAPPTRTSFDFEEQVRQTAAFEAAAFAALKTPYLVRNSSSNDASSQSPPPTLVLSSAASLTSLFAPIGDESVPPSPNKSPTSDKRPERVMLRRPAVLVPTTSSAPGPAALTRTIQLTAQETVKEDQLNAYLRWLQIQHSGSEDLTETSPREPEEILLGDRVTDRDRLFVDPTSPVPPLDARWAVPSLLADPCHPRVNAMKLEVPPAPSPEWPPYPLRSLLGPPRGSRSSM